MKKLDKPDYIYLDVCALCRLFDDQRYMRIRLETEAVQLILETVRFKKIKLAVSPVHHEEIKAITDLIERNKLLALLGHYGELVQLDVTEARRKADHYYSVGVGVADAAHLAFADTVRADFVTCDDRLLKKCRGIGLNIWYGGPLEYCIKENLK